MRDGAADRLFYEGLDCLAAGEQQRAIERLQGALVADAGHRDAAHALIRALDGAGRLDEALEAAQALVQAEPDDVLARTSLSIIYQRMGRVPEAEKAGLEAKLLGWKLELRQGPGVAVPGGEGPSGGRELGRGLLVASTNAGKMRDFTLASGGRVRLDALPGLAGIAAPAEDRDTFAGNAEVKAVYYSRFAPGELVLADDSGLEVDALGGGPGVRSARFAEDAGFMGRAGDSADERNNACLLAALDGVETGRRGARYRCVLAVARDGTVLRTASGSVEGRVLEGPQGDGGFGYDPLFFVEQRGRTMAAMGAEERLQLSHRGRALAALLNGMEDPKFATR